MIVKIAGYGTGTKTPCIHKVCEKCNEKYTSCCCESYEHEIHSKSYRPIKLVKDGKCPRCTDYKKTKDNSPTEKSCS